MATPTGFDVVVVGGGAAGCVVASRLASAQRSVLLVEAGPDASLDVPSTWRDGWTLPQIPDWGLVSEPWGTGTEPHTLRRGRVLGGTSWLTRFAVRGAAADFDAWAAAGTTGWGYADVLPWFRAIEADLDFGDRPWHGDSGPLPVSRYLDMARTPIHEAALAAFAAIGFPVVDDHNAPEAIGAGPLPMSTRDGRRVTGLDAWLPAPGGNPGLAVRTDALVDSVLVEAGRAVGVRLADGSEIPAGWVVLSGGTYGSPAVLLRSGIGPANELRAQGISVRLDLRGVGDNLADHPGVDVDSGWRGDPAGHGPLHSIATFRSSLRAPGDAPDLMFWASDPAGDEPRFYLDPILLKPRSRGRVQLRSADPTDAPIITLPAFHETADVDRLVEGYRLALEIANRPEIRALAGAPPPEDPRTPSGFRRRVLQDAYSMPHVVGTCALGQEATGGAVVDRRGTVHGIEALSVIDASIIPEAPAGFPHLITLMLAERLAADLNARI